MTAAEYFDALQSHVHQASHVVSASLNYTEIDKTICYIKGNLSLLFGYQLHVAEYVSIEPSITRTKYRYHLQDSEHKLTARWDNAPHHPSVNTFPDHRHDADGIIRDSEPMDIWKVLSECVPNISASN